MKFILSLSALVLLSGCAQFEDMPTGYGAYHYDHNQGEIYTNDDQSMDASSGYDLGNDMPDDSGIMNTQDFDKNFRKEQYKALR